MIKKYTTARVQITRRITMGAEMSSETQSALWIEVLGEFAARQNGVPLEGLHERHGRELLACLSVQYGRFVTNENLLNRIGSEEAGEGVIRQSLSQLRHLLGAQRDRLEVHNRQVRIVLTAGECDLAQFDQAIHEENLPAIVRLYRGRVLEGFEGAWLDKERLRRHEQFLRAAKHLASSCRAHGDFAEAVIVLKEYLKYQKIEEWAWVELMEAQAESQERLCALHTYELCTSFFKQKFGVGPPAAMTLLSNRLRAALPRAAPLPATTTSLPSVGGAVPLGSPFYLARSCDSALKNAVNRRDSIVLLTGSRQTGKSSLLARGLEQAREQQAQTIITDFETLRSEDLQTMEALCRCLAAALAENLNLRIQPEAMWKPQRPPQANLDRYLHQHALAVTSLPLVWGLDGVDKVFGCPVQNEFFAMLRSWHEKRVFEPQKSWHNLTVVLACAVEAHLYVRDLNKSPFNVGTRISLTDFSQAQMELLNTRYASPLAGSEEALRFYRFVGGHPYLIHRGLDEMARNQWSLDTFLTVAALETGPFADHLRQLWQFLLQDVELREAVAAVIDGRICASPAFFRLRSAGLLTGQESSIAVLRCGLYAQYFQRRSEA